MALLLRPSPPPRHLRRLLSTAAASPTSRMLPSLRSPAPATVASARFLFGPRVVSAAAAPRQNGFAVRAFMASEAMQEKRVAGEYTAANVQNLIEATMLPFLNGNTCD